MKPSARPLDLLYESSTLAFPARACTWNLASLLGFQGRLPHVTGKSGYRSYQRLQKSPMFMRLVTV
jgi:hypothetical protein